MSSEPNPSEKSAEQVAVQYIEEQVKTLRTRFRRTQIITVVLVLGVLAYLSFITHTLKKEFLNPEPAAAMLNLQLSSVINENAPALTAELKLQIPALISSIPDRIIEQLPAVRVALEEQLENQLRQYALDTGDQLASHLDDFLTENREAIHALVEAAENTEGLAHLGDLLEEELSAYLQTKGEDGQSIKDRLDLVLADMGKIEERLQRLATAPDLTPEEKQLRRAIAITTAAAAREVNELTPLLVGD